MSNEPSSPLKGFEDAEVACKRVEPEANALTEDQFSAMNVDVIAATSIILGVAPRILPFRDRMARLPEFDIHNVDSLVDRAKAAWYAVVTNLPEPEPRDFQAMFDECVALRTTLLTWAAPLVHARKFDQAAIDKIKEGSGNKDVPSDVVALVALYRSQWDSIKGICGVTEADLERGAAIAPVVFAAVSRRENREAYSQSDGAQRVRRFWTLADRSYRQCQRALTYLQWDEGNVAALAPSLRRNSGTREASQPAPAQAETPASPASPASPDAPAADPAVGDGSPPFIRR
jgi:hypothetical protein